jgi:hypothetical protein
MMVNRRGQLLRGTAHVASSLLTFTETRMNLHMAPIASLIAGVLILLIPRLLKYIVAIYLIVIGLIGLFGTGSLRL